MMPKNAVGIVFLLTFKLIIFSTSRLEVVQERLNGLVSAQSKTLRTSVVVCSINQFYTSSMKKTKVRLYLLFLLLMERASKQNLKRRGVTDLSNMFR